MSHARITFGLMFESEIESRRIEFRRASVESTTITKSFVFPTLDRVHYNNLWKWKNHVCKSYIKENDILMCI